ncbi:MAG: LamG domain-containing protein [Pirellulales bacterium]|nr:LamG domain-containing protein [Pirellulales bacterium]
MVHQPHLVLWIFSIACLAGIAFGQQARGPEPGTDNLAGWWKFDETSGLVASDASKHGRKGSLKGGLSFDQHSVPGRIGKALQFDGKKNWIQIPEYRGVTGSAPRTVAAWMKTSNRQGDIIRWGSDDAGKVFRIGFIRGHLGLDPSGGYLYIQQNIADDRWHHMAVVVAAGDPPNLHDHVQLFVDGAPAAIHDIGLLDLWPIDTGSDEDISIGRGFSGTIDEIRLYDRALSSEEIKELFKLQ